MMRRIIALCAAVLLVAAIAAHALGDEMLAERLGDGLFLALVLGVAIPASRDERADSDGPSKS